MKYHANGSAWYEFGWPYWFVFIRIPEVGIHAADAAGISFIAVLRGT